MSKKWYVVQVMSGHENKVKKRIEDNKESCGFGDYIEEVIVPSENVSEVKGGQQKITEKRLWPGYILVKLDLNEEIWVYIKKTTGVICFIGKEKPVSISDEEVDVILKDMQNKKGRVVQKQSFSVGDSVKIIDGVFINFVGTVLEVFHEKGKVSVMVSIFGRDTRVDDLEFWQVEKTTQED